MNINFAVTSAVVLRKINPFEKDSLIPGLIDTVLTLLSEIEDAKKIPRGRGKGDVNLFGFEQEVLSEKVHKLAVEKELVSFTCVLLEECSCKYVSGITNSKKEEVVQKLKQIIPTLAQLIHTLRQTKIIIENNCAKLHEHG